MSNDALTARRLIVHGHVQGVFYRDWTVETASALGLAGWVRNCSDETLEAHLEGKTPAIERMVAAIHEGPPRARVERVEQSKTTAKGFNTFERR